MKMLKPCKNCGPQKPSRFDGMRYCDDCRRIGKRELAVGFLLSMSAANLIAIVYMLVRLSS